MPGKLEAQTLETDEGRVVGRREQGLPEPSQLLPVAPQGQCSGPFGASGELRSEHQGSCPSFSFTVLESEMTRSRSLAKMVGPRREPPSPNRALTSVTGGRLVFHLASTFASHCSFSVCPFEFLKSNFSPDACNPCFRRGGLH